MATTVRIPLALMTVSLANANCFWEAKDGTNFDYGYIGFVDNADGEAIFWGIIPTNIAVTPAWNLVLHHGVNSGAGGNVVLNISGEDFADGATIDQSLTTLESGLTLATGASGLQQIDVTNGSNYDGTEAVAASNLLLVKIVRDGDNASDTLSAQWNLFAVALRVDIG